MFSALVCSSLFKCHRQHAQIFPPAQPVTITPGRHAMVSSVAACCEWPSYGAGLTVHCQLECGPMPNLMAAQPHISGALRESSVKQFLVPRRKVWLTPLLECRAVTLPISQNARLGRKVNFARGKIPSRGKRSRKCMYSVPGQETTKHSAKFG